MRCTFDRVSVHRSSTIIALLYGILGIVYIPLLYLGNAAEPPDEKIPALLIWLMPLILAALTYVALAIVFALYNALAKRVGGIEVTVTADAGS